jgi:hypothetical protein
MVDPTKPPSTKVRTGDAIITHGARAIELEDVEARVSELERAAPGETNVPWRSSGTVAG